MVAISQDLDTVAGETYFVTFILAGNPGFQGVHTLRVTAPGYTHDFDFDTTGKNVTNIGWAERDFTFVASGATSTLTFCRSRQPQQRRSGAGQGDRHPDRRER